MDEPDLTGLDAKARRFLAMVAVGAAKGAYASIADRRRSFDQLMRFSQQPAGEVHRSDLTIHGARGDLPLRIYAPAGAPALLAGLVYFHGGGLVAGSIATHDAICASLALGARCRVLSVGYRLAPEHPFPAAIVDALRATRWIFRNATVLGIDRIAVGGDSGGATLATIVCQLTTRRLPIKAQMLLCPFLDYAGAHVSRESYADGFMLDAATMAQDLVHYAPTRDLGDPRVSPLRQPELAGLPRTLIHTAGFDPLRDEGAAYAARLEKAGVAVEHVCHDALIHHFYGLTGAIPAARTALSAIGSDLARVLA